MKAMMNIFPILIIPLLLAACSKTSTPGFYSTSTFPLTEGSNWHYQVYYQFPIDSTSEDSLIGEMIRRVIGPDSVDNMMIMDDTTITYHEINHDTSATRYWCSIDNNSFSIHAIDLDADGDRWPIWHYSEPLIMLNFPLETGKTWMSGPIGGEYAKEVMEIDTVYFEGNALACDVIYSEYIGYPDDYPEHIYEWYTNDGLMAKQIIIVNSRRRFELMEYSIAER